jgi:serine/threonine-protein kinase ATR
VEPFLNNELNEASTRVVSFFREKHKSSEEPPAKRRRTVPEQNNSQSDILNHLMMTLNGSSSDSPVLDLKDFHLLIQ